MPETSFRGRTLARSQAVQLLYQAEFTNRTVEEVLAGSYVVSGAVPGDYTISRVTPGKPGMPGDPDDGKVWVWEQRGQRRILPAAEDGTPGGIEEAPGDFVRVRLRNGDDKGTLDVRGHSFRILVWDADQDAYVTALSVKEGSLALEFDETGCTVTDDHGGKYLIVDHAGILDHYALELARGAGAQVEVLDQILDQNSPNWGVSRMPALDRNLLRIALYEMLFVDDTDTSVAIDECVELFKSYGTDDSSRFVNGVLGTIARLDKDPADLLGEAREQVCLRHEEEERRLAEEAEARRLAEEEERRLAEEEARRLAEEEARLRAEEEDPYEPAPESALFEPLGEPVRTDAPLRPDDYGEDW